MSSKTTNCLDGLKGKAEQMVVREGLTRRPTWAPPLVITGELLDLLFQLTDLTPEHKPIARLWARFTDPRRGPVLCEGFHLRVGQEHNGKEIFRAQYHNKAVTLANLRKALDKPFEGANDEAIRKSIERWETREDWSLGPNWLPPGPHWKPELIAKQRLYIRATELAGNRVLEFAGDPYRQMQIGGTLSGRCCCCGKTLTDPISIEYGIGPECRKGRDVRNFPGAWWLPKTA